MYILDPLTHFSSSVLLSPLKSLNRLLGCWACCYVLQGLYGILYGDVQRYKGLGQRGYMGYLRLRVLGHGGYTGLYGCRVSDTVHANQAEKYHNRLL